MHKEQTYKVRKALVTSANIQDPNPEYEEVEVTEKEAKVLFRQHVSHFYARRGDGESCIFLEPFSGIEWELTSHESIALGFVSNRTPAVIILFLADRTWDGSGVFPVSHLTHALKFLPENATVQLEVNND
jgi:hypothetical protein